MKRNISLIVLFLIVGVSPLFSAIVNDYAITTGTKATVYDLGDASLPWHVSNSDLLNGITGTLLQGGFHSATVPSADTDRIATLTDGVWAPNGLTVIATDYGEAFPNFYDLILEYNFTTPKNISSIIIFAGHDGDGARGFINCDVAIDTGSGYIDLYKEFKTGPYGASAHDNSSVSAARLYQSDAGHNIASNVQKLKFSFYDCTHNNANAKFIKWNDNTTEGNYPNQGTILKEIDVFEGYSSEENWHIY